MQNTNYFTAEEATIVVSCIVTFVVLLILFFIKGPRYQGKRRVVLEPLAICCLLLIGLPITTHAAQNSNILASYFPILRRDIPIMVLFMVFLQVWLEGA